jgi:hypothetical protein
MQANETVNSEMTIGEFTHRVFAAGKITRADENWLLRATLSATPLNHEDQKLVRQMQVRLQMGLLKVVD